MPPSIKSDILYQSSSPPSVPSWERLLVTVQVLQVSCKLQTATKRRNIVPKPFSPAAAVFLEAFSSETPSTPSLIQAVAGNKVLKYCTKALRYLLFPAGSVF